MSAADVLVLLGFVLLAAGVWLTWGVGPALIVAGTLLFLGGRRVRAQCPAKSLSCC